MADLTIGIDFGTSSCRIGAFVNGRVELVKDENDVVLDIPNCVSFTELGRLIGKDAVELSVTNAWHTLSGIKRFVGGVDVDGERLSCGKVLNPDGTFSVVVTYKGVNMVFGFTEIAGMVLGRLKEMAQTYFSNYVVKDAVVSVPASAGNMYRQAILDAGKIGGLPIVQVISDTSAIGIGYLYHYNNGQVQGTKTLMILDFGGGSVDCSVVTLQSEPAVVHVNSSCCDPRLGGLEFDDVLFRHFYNEYRQQMEGDLVLTEPEKQRLRQECEVAKKSLTAQNSYTINLQFGRDEGFSTVVSRVQFEEMTLSLRQKMIDMIIRASRASNIAIEKIDEVVVSGDSTKIPSIRTFVQIMFPGILVSYVNNDRLLIRGLAHQAGLVSNAVNCAATLVLDVCPLAIGLCVPGGQTMDYFNGNTPILARASNHIPTGNVNTMSCVVIERELGLGSFKKIGVLVIIDIRTAFTTVTLETDPNGIIIASRDNTNVVLQTNKMSHEQVALLSNKELGFKEDDILQIQTATARHHLEKYVFQMKQEAQSVGEPEDAENLIIARCDGILSWIENNSHVATKEDYEVRHQKLINEFHNPGHGSQM